jgi:NTE family protein
VMGISIGAINAAVLVGAKEDPISTLDYVWRQKFTTLQSLPAPLRTLAEAFIPPSAQKYLSRWGDSGMYRLRPEFLLLPLLATSIYDLTPLRETLEAVVDIRKLNRPDGTRLAVSAVNVSSGKFTTFDSRDGLTLDHILASGSLPPSFPMTAIDGESYWDGGLFFNTPLSKAINYLEELEPDDARVRREIVVVELFPRRAAVPTDLVEVLNRAAQLFFTSKLAVDAKLFAEFNAFVDLVRTIDRIVPPDAREVREHPGYKELMRHWKMDALTVITFQADPALGLPGDFSQATIEARIEAGYRDAIDQRIWEPTPVPLGVVRLGARSI